MYKIALGMSILAKNFHNFEPLIFESRFLLEKIRVKSFIQVAFFLYNFVQMLPIFHTTGGGGYQSIIKRTYTRFGVLQRT